MIVENFWVFALTGLLLNLTPGNDMLYIIARSSGQGTKAGVVSALGIGAGCFVHIAAAVAGLSAVLTQSAAAFTVIKYIGAAYLAYLGVKTFLTKKSSFQIEPNAKQRSFKNLFWQGVLTNILNPKVALFFLAFLPQFVSVRQQPAALQILFLGTWFNVVGTLVNAGVAFLFGSIRTILTTAPAFIKWQERVTGLVLIALGIKVALSKK